MKEKLEGRRDYRKERLEGRHDGKAGTVKKLER